MNRRLKENEVIKNVRWENDHLRDYIETVAKFYETRNLTAEQVDCLDLMTQYDALNHRLFEFKHQYKVAAQQFKQTITSCFD